MKVLVVIVTYNGMKWLPKALGSVSACDVMVVDNGSTDGSVDWIRANCPEVMLVESGENLGFGRANNLGLSYAVRHGYGYVYLMNQDAWVLPGTIEALVAASEADASYGVLSPMQMTADGERMDSIFKDKCGGYLGVEAELAPVPFVMAAHWLIPVRVLKQVGAFSPAFPHYGEDDNFIHRLSFHGYRAGVLKSVKAVHDRESRPLTKKAHMWRKYMSAVAGVEDPNRCFAWQVVKQTVLLLLFCVRYLTLLPLGHAFRLLGRLPELRRTRGQSMERQGAFLDLG